MELYETLIEYGTAVAYERNDCSDHYWEKLAEQLLDRAIVLAPSTERAALAELLRSY